MPKVLVVDDESFIVRMIRDKLEPAGIDVLTGGNGREAVTKAQAEKPDLIILDWMMPEMGGIEVCRALKGDAATASIPIFMLTARGQQQDEQAGRAAGVMDYITKPFSPRQLLARVKEVLRLP